MRRPWHALASLGAFAHHAFELGAGTGLVFQPYLGLRRATVLWGVVLPSWLAAAARGSDRWDRPLAFAAGMSVGAAGLHFTLWPWRLAAGAVPVLTQAEGLKPRHLPAYNAILYAWAVPAVVAVAVDTPSRVRPWALAGMAAAGGFRPSASHHFRWVRDQARSNPAWWNRALRD